LTNVGQARIASELLHMPITHEALRALIVDVVKDGRGYSQQNVERLLSELKFE
jgi:hypothetical protein